MAAALVGPVSAEEQIGARGFVAHTYVQRTSNRGFRFASPRVLTPDLYDLARRAGAALDRDPLCQCKDIDGLSAQILSVTGTPNRATARVLLRFDADAAAPPQRVTLTLTRSAGGWKIADVASARMPSLRAWLVRRASAVPR